MRTVRIVVVGLTCGLLAGCGPKGPDFESAPVRIVARPADRSAAAPAPAVGQAPTAAPATAAPAPAPVPVDAEAEAAAVAKLPALETVSDPVQRNLEAGRRALVLARASLAAKSFAKANEDLEVAKTALTQAGTDLKAKPAVAARVDGVVGALNRHEVLTAADVEPLLDALKQAGV